MTIRRKYKRYRQQSAAQLPTREFQLTTIKSSITKKKPGQHSNKRKFNSKELNFNSLKYSTRQRLHYIYPNATTKQLTRPDLESRLDVILYHTDLTSSKHHARQVINHNHVFVNGRLANFPSYGLKIGDVIQVRNRSNTTLTQTQYSSVEVNYYINTAIVLDVRAPMINPIYAFVKRLKTKQLGKNKRKRKFRLSHSYTHK